MVVKPQECFIYFGFCRFSEKIKAFQNEIESRRNEAKDIDDESLIWSYLCSNPVHVFQLNSASDIITKDIISFMEGYTGTFKVNSK